MYLLTNLRKLIPLALTYCHSKGYVLVNLSIFRSLKQFKFWLASHADLDKPSQILNCFRDDPLIRPEYLIIRMRQKISIFL